MKCLHVGHGQAGCRTAASLKMTGVDVEACEVSNVYRQRRSPGVVSPSAALRGRRSSRPSHEAGPRRIQGRWEPTHGYQHAQPSCLTGSSSSYRQRKKQGADVKKLLSTLDIGSHINAGRQPRLEAVACTPWFGLAWSHVQTALLLGVLRSTRATYALSPHWWRWALPHHPRLRRTATRCRHSWQGPRGSRHAAQRPPQPPRGREMTQHQRLQGWQAFRHAAGADVHLPKPRFDEELGEFLRLGDHAGGAQAHGGLRAHMPFHRLPQGEAIRIDRFLPDAENQRAARD